MIENIVEDEVIIYDPLKILEEIAEQIKNHGKETK